MKERYDNLDGFRTISCLCIIAMHIRANASYSLPLVLDSIVASWTQFVPLFLMVSGFGMFCGYYEKFRDGSIDLKSFYSKRYSKLIPFFLVLIIIDIAIDRSISHVIEGIMEATLVFGLLPNNQMEVIGVSWTLGVIFLFYMLFPFVVYLCWNKKKAWLTFIGSIILSLLCSFYFFTDKFVVDSFAPRHNFLYCAPWIIGGGLVYMHRESVKVFISKHRWIWLGFCLCLTVGWYFIPGLPVEIDMLVVRNMLLFLPWLMYAISVKSKILSNRATKYLSGISLEMYLAHMVFFRAIEKIKGLYLAGKGWIGFVCVWIAVVVGLVVAIEIWKRLLFVAKKKLRMV